MRNLKKSLNVKKSEYHHGDLKNVLIQTAQKILQEEGFDKLTLRYCTQKAGVSPSALSHHFKNLEGLLTAVAAKGFIELAALFRKALEERQKNDDGVRCIIRSYLGFAIEHSDLYRTMFSPKLGKDDPEYIEANQECFFILKNEMMLKEKKLAGLTPEIAAFRIWALAHGYLLMVLNNHVEHVMPESTVPHGHDELEKIFFDYLLKNLW